VLNLIAVLMFTCVCLALIAGYQRRQGRSLRDIVRGGDSGLDQMPTQPPERETYFHRLERSAMPALPSARKRSTQRATTFAVTPYVSAAWALERRPWCWRWGVVAGDQIGWTAQSVTAWAAMCEAEDPRGQAWVLARHEDRIQYLGGFLGADLVKDVAASQAVSLRELAGTLPCRVIASVGSEWLDVDCPNDLARFPGNSQGVAVPVQTGPHPPG